MSNNGKITWTTEARCLGDLQPWERNPRQIREAEARRLFESFDQFGQVETIAIGPGNEVYNGHQRLNVLMEKYGPDYVVDCRISSRPLTEKEREKLTVYLHKGAAGEWNWDELANWDTVDLLKWGFENTDFEMHGIKLGKNGEPAEDPGPQIDRANELRQKWGVETGQLWQLGEHRLLCGDSTKAEDVTRVMMGEKANVTFTDPPFNVGYEYSEYDDRRSDYPEFTRKWIERAAEITNDGWLFVMNITKNLELTLCELSRVSEFANLVVWPHGTGAIPSDRFALGWQCISVYRKGKPFFSKKAQTKESVVSDERGGGVNPLGRITDVWDDIKPVTAGSRSHKEAILQDGSKAKIHHAQMPLALPDRAISFCSQEGDIVYEPFSGSGTTLIACERLGRKCRAIEISSAYVSVAIQRFYDMTGVMPMLVDR